MTLYRSPVCLSTYVSCHSNSGASRVDHSKLHFISQIVQNEDFLLVLQQDELGKQNKVQ